MMIYVLTIALIWCAAGLDLYIDWYYGNKKLPYTTINFHLVWLIGFGYVKHWETINMAGQIIKQEYSFYLPFIEIKIERF